MKKYNIINKFKYFYYVGLSVIIGVLLTLFILLSIVSGLIINSLRSDDNDNDNDNVSIQVLDTPTKKEIYYDTVKVEIYDTIPVYLKKVKPVVIENGNNDTLEQEKNQL